MCSSSNCRADHDGPGTGASRRSNLFNSGITALCQNRSPESRADCHQRDIRINGYFAANISGERRRDNIGIKLRGSAGLRNRCNIGHGELASGMCSTGQGSNAFQPTAVGRVEGDNVGTGPSERVDVGRGGGNDDRCCRIHSFNKSYDGQFGNFADRANIFKTFDPKSPRAADLRRAGECDDHVGIIHWAPDRRLAGYYEFSLQAANC
jgi:hypothetical protein